MVNATALKAEMAPKGCFVTSDGGLYFNTAGLLDSTYSFAKSLCKLRAIVNSAGFTLPPPSAESIDACGVRRVLRTYDIRAKEFELAVLALAPNCSACALRVSKGTAVLSKDLSIGGGYDFDLVVLAQQPWRNASSQPMTSLDLNLHHVTVVSSNGTTSKLCIQDLRIQNGKAQDGGEFLE